MYSKTHADFLDVARYIFVSVEGFVGWGELALLSSQCFTTIMNTNHFSLLQWLFHEVQLYDSHLNNRHSLCCFFFFFFKRRDVSLLLRSTSGFYKSTQIKFIFSIYLFFYINLKKKNKTDHTFFRVVHTVYCLEEPSIHIILNPWEHLWWLGKDELNKISMEEKKKLIWE